LKCRICYRFSFLHICKKCQKLFLKPTLLETNALDLKIFSLYQYSDIEDLIKSKYHIYGSYIFKILAKNSIAPFFKKLNFDKKIYAIAIDDNPKNYYSHSAILLNQIKNRGIKPLYGVLRAKNDIQYAGKSKDFRLKNPRNFIYSGKSDIEVVLIDDVVTYGITLLEAKRVLEKSGVRVKFALTLAKTMD